MDLLYRALFGGLIVSLFAVLGDVLEPKSLGGTLGTFSKLRRTEPS